MVRISNGSRMISANDGGNSVKILAQTDGRENSVRVLKSHRRRCPFSKTTPRSTIWYPGSPGVGRGAPKNETVDLQRLSHFGKSGISRLNIRLRYIQDTNFRVFTDQLVDQLLGLPARFLCK